MIGVSYEMGISLLTNAPNLVIQSVLWHRYSMNVSVLLMQNVMRLVVGLHEIYEYFSKSRSTSCRKYNQWFIAYVYANHKIMCDAQDRKSADMNCHDYIETCLNFNL